MCVRERVYVNVCVCVCVCVCACVVVRSVCRLCCVHVIGNLRLKHGQSRTAKRPEFVGHEFAIQLLRKDREY